MRIMLLLLLIGCIHFTIGSQEIVTEHLNGTIGNSPVTFDIISNAMTMKGTYYYTKLGTTLTITGEKNPDGTYTVHESVDDKNTGMMTLKYTDDGFFGEWVSHDGKKRAPVKAEFDKSAVQFAVRTIEMNQHLFNDTTKPACSIILNYLEPADTLTGKIPDELNRSLMKAFFGEFALDTVRESSIAITKEFQTGFLALEKEYAELVKDGYPFQWTYEQNMSIVFNDFGILTLETTVYSFAGGAHPNGSIFYTVIDRKTGKIIAFDDIFISGSQKKLSTMITAEILSTMKKHDPSIKKLSDAGFFEDTVQPNANIVVTKAGIKFVYNAYEIAPYVVGLQEVLLPYFKIRELIKKDCLIRELF